MNFYLSQNIYPEKCLFLHLYIGGLFALLSKGVIKNIFYLEIGISLLRNGRFCTTSIGDVLFFEAIFGWGK